MKRPWSVAFRRKKKFLAQNRRAFLFFLLLIAVPFGEWSNTARGHLSNGCATHIKREIYVCLLRTILYRQCCRWRYSRCYQPDKTIWFVRNDTNDPEQFGSETNRLIGRKSATSAASRAGDGNGMDIALIQKAPLRAATLFESGEPPRTRVPFFCLAKRKEPKATRMAPSSCASPSWTGADRRHVHVPRSPRAILRAPRWAVPVHDGDARRRPNGAKTGSARYRGRYTKSENTFWE